MKTILVLLLLAGCATTQPTVVLPPKTETVQINPALLSPCASPIKLTDSTTLLQASGQWFVAMKECSDKQKALSDIVRSAFNTDSK